MMEQMGGAGGMGGMGEMGGGGDSDDEDLPDLPADEGADAEDEAAVKGKGKAKADVSATRSSSYMTDELFGPAGRRRVDLRRFQGHHMYIADVKGIPRSCHPSPRLYPIGVVFRNSS
jgi:hypothetical protein